MSHNLQQRVYIPALRAFFKTCFLTVAAIQEFQLHAVFAISSNTTCGKISATFENLLYRQQPSQLNAAACDAAYASRFALLGSRHRISR